MNDVHIKNQAVTGERLARLVRHGVVACVLACSAAGAIAGGQDRTPRRDDLQQQRYEPRAQDQRFDQRAYDDARRQEQAMREQQRAEQSMREQDSRRGARMTPDERRELKRQINEANVDLYPNARRR